ncbi:MAG: hypothetical protein GY913_06530 [Proteobacteria bacterium]|nr:hypothetical protein [Pseudomonadota bacterium]MCP4916561.1 hypothetical protein [Pseudomonadota bacterium]
MNIPDPFSPLEGGRLHQLDKNVAEALTGVPEKTLSAHAIGPAVELGVDEDNARAVLHWGVVGAVGYGAFEAARWLKRNVFD